MSGHPYPSGAVAAGATGSWLIASGWTTALGWALICAALLTAAVMTAARLRARRRT